MSQGGAHGPRERSAVSGDAILAVDGVRVAELGFAAATNRIRRPEGSRVSPTVLSDKPKEPRLIDVPRRRVRS